jgi:uncharacterized membrane protein
MTLLILGLVIFIGVHSVRIFADDWRHQMRNKMGDGAWKGLYSLLSIGGFALIVIGYGMARQETSIVWTPLMAMKHLAALLTLVAFIMVTAAFVPRNSIKAKLHHPMILGVKVWALAHLLANGTMAQMVLFGSFLAWAVLNFRAARQRDRANGTQYPAGTMGGTLTTVVVGVALWAAFAFWLHGILIGVRPFG